GGGDGVGPDASGAGDQSPGSGNRRAAGCDRAGRSDFLHVSQPCRAARAGGALWRSAEGTAMKALALTAVCALLLYGCESTPLPQLSASDVPSAFEQAREAS